MIDQAAIRRSGATNLPDFAAWGSRRERRSNGCAATGSISIRGFSDLYREQIAGADRWARGIHAPLFGGVYWDTQDVPLEDIDRIEVIRGPGSAVWGANAVNGVINIITKSAKDTQGGLVSASAGSRNQCRRAGSIWRVAWFRRHLPRVAANISISGNEASDRQIPVDDGSHGFHGGFRSDWNLGKPDGLVIQGDVAQSPGGETLVNAVSSNSLPLTSTLPDEIRYTGANVLGRWDHAMANGAAMSLQAYDDYVYQDCLWSQRVQQYIRSGFSPSPCNRIAKRRRVGIRCADFGKHAWTRIQSQDSAR